MTTDATLRREVAQRRRVCIIGAGAGGLISCKEMLDQGLEVVVYEAAECVGGTWVLRDKKETKDTNTCVVSGNDLIKDYDSRGLDVSQHSSMYDALHTNLPVDLMNIPGFKMGDESTARYPHHTVVRNYLQDYCNTCDLSQYIQFNTTVTRVEYMGEKLAFSDTDTPTLYKCDRQWNVHTITNQNGNIEKRAERFDAIVSANGHYSQPCVPKGKLGDDLKARYTGRVIHSHRYRRPDGYEGKTIAVIGGGPSGRDIARDLAPIAKHVYLCADVPAVSYLRQLDNCTIRGRLIGVSEQGDLITADDKNLSGVDEVILCTGYNYDLPYFKGTELDRVSPTKKYMERLYMHFFDIDHPSVCHIGLPFAIVPFPLFQYQSKLAARVYAGKVKLPTLGQMEHERRAEEQIALDWAASERQEGAPGVVSEEVIDPLDRVHHFKPPGNLFKQFHYMDAIADMCNGGPAVGISATGTGLASAEVVECEQAKEATSQALHDGVRKLEKSVHVNAGKSETEDGDAKDEEYAAPGSAAPVKHTPPYFKTLYAGAKDERFALLGY